MSAIHTLTFPRESVLSGDGESEARLTIAAQLLATIGAVEEDAVMALPAGWVRARSDEERDAWAESLRASSQESGVGIVFGIDVGDDDNWGAERRPRSLAYAFASGRPRLMPATAARGPTSFAERAVTIAGCRLVVLVGREIFLAAAAAVVRQGRPDLALVLAHGGATPKWVPALAALDELAPTLVVRQELPLRAVVWDQSPRGWTTVRGEPNGLMHLVSYRLDGRLPDAASSIEGRG
jgi:hypothetical protein